MSANPNMSANVNTTPNETQNETPNVVLSGGTILTDPIDFGDADLKKQIAAIIGVEVSAAWSIVDADPEKDVYLVHYSVQADMNKYSDLRGIVVALRHRAIIARSYPYTPSATLDELKVDVDGTLRFTDDSGTDHIVPTNRILIKPKFEGTLLRIFKYDGKVYHSTHRRLDASRSRWGNSATFLEMYEELGGPPDDELFDPEYDFSPYCHLFLIVHPDVLNVSKISIDPGVLVYLGPKQMYSVESVEFAQDEVDSELRTPAVSSEFVQDGHTIHTPFNLTIEEANKHLRYGFYNPYDDKELEPRLRTGEAVVMNLLNDQGQIQSCIQVQSVAYQWRLEMRGNDPNLLHRFYELVDFSYLPTDTDEGLAEYRRKFPILTYHPLAEIEKCLAENGPMIIWPDGQATTVWLNSRNMNLYNIFLAFLMSVPLHRQFGVSQMYTHLQDKRAELIAWVASLEATQSDVLVSPDYSDRVKNIISAARSFTSNSLNSRKRTNFTVTVAGAIKNLLLKERGSSLYRLIREMDCDKEVSLKDEVQP